MINAKRAGKAAPAIAEPKQSNVINLMDALRKSAKADRTAPAKRKSATHRKRPTAKRKVKKAG
jgi:non-homologous end joining protein Ku